MRIGSVPSAEPQPTLSRPFASGKLRVPNRFCAHPMEGCDADNTGRPTDFTFRRYRRLAEGGTGLIWMEACSVDPAGRGNPRQLMINEDTADALAELAAETREHARNQKGETHEPAIVLQLTHSGRYSRPNGSRSPQLVRRCMAPGETVGVSSGVGRLLADDDLERIRDAYVHAAVLAEKCGFDAVDVKACHGYLLHELLTARMREDSCYGGSFERRTGLLKSIITSIREECLDLAVVTRLCVFDNAPSPWGWGTNEVGEADLEEPARLMRELSELGIELVSLGFGNPYVSAHIGRPYDRPIQGDEPAPECPLDSVLRILELTQQIRRLVPGVPFVATGLSWLRHLAPYIGAGMVAEGWVDLVGFGRLSIANPGFVNETLKNGRIASNRFCIGCSACVELMRGGGRSGCVVHDGEVYGPEYRKVIADRRETDHSSGADCPEEE